MNDENISDILSTFTEEATETTLPAKCNECKTSTICGPIDAFINLAKIGIQIEVSRCPYFK